ncbi:AraC family transcriptional regulator [Aestuariicella sp. G3-2]|uniref:AraC family transcriptional regulator n=1 Tax=Pseudomaricurvus albidus TaxID=2842452 RepID=UPI001C0B9FCB|nr:AraC family transcriptional regulator [Aestuariicella albida]MBU3069587.1 AraC family transcriptional regulator [Aestuariicella albida]
MNSESSPNADLQVSVSLTQSLVKALQEYPVPDIDDLLLQAGIDPAVLLEPENRIPFYKQEKFWQLANRSSGDAGFPLTFAEHTQPASFSVAGYIVMNCSTIGEAMESVVTYQRSAGEGGSFALQREEQHLNIRYLPVNPDSPISPVRSCAMIAANLVFGRWLVGSAYTPTQVSLCFPEPEHQQRFDDFFQCPVAYNQDSDFMLFPRALENTPIPHASHEMLDLMKQRADKIIHQTTHKSPVTAQVSKLISESLLGQEPDKARIADQLGVSQRTLQRKLAKEDTSYQEVLDKTRHQLALDYLQQPKLTITDTAYLLGFTEPSAFYRAFKKWHGMTPGRYRETQQN